MRLFCLVVLLACGALVTGCQSTFDQAEQARKEAGPITEVNAAKMSQVAGVTAEALAIIPSADGTTAAVVIKVSAEAAGSSLLWAPIEVKLFDAAGTEVGTNNIPGALPILIHLASVQGGKSAYYVNDQILLSGTPATAEIVVGGELLPIDAPDNLATTEPVLVPDPDFGDSWTTTVTNNTDVRQEQLVVQAIVRDGDTIVGAGTANIDGLDPGESVDVTGYFIGSSKGKLEVVTPASNAKDGSGAPAPTTAGSSTTSSSPSESSGSVSTPVMTLQID